MKLELLNNVIKLWDKVFLKHVWLEAFLLSFIVHIIFIGFMWTCCQIHVILFAPKDYKQVVEIEFIKSK